MQKIRNKIIVGIVALSTIVLSSCNVKNQNVSSQQHIVSQTASSSSKASNDNDIPTLQKTDVISEMDYTKVFGNLKINKFTAKMSNGVLWFPISISDNGEVFGFTSSANGKLSNIIVCDVLTHKVSTIYTIKGGYQPEFFQENSHYLMWTEYLPPSESGNSRVVLFDRDTKAAISLNDRSADYASVSSDQIALGDDFALWSTGTKNASGKTTYQIRKYDFITKQITIFKDNAVMPVIGNNFVAWLSPENDTVKNSTIMIEYIDNNNVQQLTKGQIPMYMAAYGDMLVYSGYADTNYLDKTKKVIPTSQLVLYKGGKMVVLEKSDNHLYEYPEITNNFISWDENGRRRVYCINKNVIADFPEEYDKVHISNKYFYWGTDTIKNESSQQAEKDGMYMTDLHVVDIDN